MESTWRYHQERQWSSFLHRSMISSIQILNLETHPRTQLQLAPTCLAKKIIQAECFFSFLFSSFGDIFCLPTMEDIAKRHIIKKNKKLKRGGIGIKVIASGYDWKVRPTPWVITSSTSTALFYGKIIINKIHFLIK